MEKIIGRGAEAILIQQDSKLIKRRIAKGYRLIELDEKLRRQRTKREARLLEKASKLIPVPKIISTDAKSREKVEGKTAGFASEIDMQFIEGKKLSEYLDNLPNAEDVCREIGTNTAKLHDADIIHGDLTTSNMILKDNKVFFIDFGLGFESKKIEDKAVDLHLLRQALEAKHFNNYEKFFNAAKEGYKASKHYAATLKRLEAVEKRGRYKKQY